MNKYKYTLNMFEDRIKRALGIRDNETTFDVSIAKLLGKTDTQYKLWCKDILNKAKEEHLKKTIKARDRKAL